MLGVPLPRFVTATPFVTDPSEPTFSQIWMDTMGGVSTGLDVAGSNLDEAILLTSSIAATADIDPGDLATLSALDGALGTMDSGPLATQLQGAAAATDGALGDYNTLTQPSATPTQPVQPPGTQPPNQQPAACTPPRDNPAKILQGMAVGDAPLDLYIDSEVYGGPNDQLDIRGKLLCGDAEIFASHNVVSSLGFSLSNPTRQMTLNLRVTPTKAGTFTGAYEETEISTGNITDYWFTVNITETLNKGTGGQPLPTQL